MADLTPNLDTVRVPNPLTDSLTTARAIQDALGKLRKEDADQIRSLLRGNLTDEQKDTLARITSLDNFKKASGEPMVAILAQLAAETRDPRQSGLSWVLREPNFAALDAKQQTAVIELLTAATGASGLGEKLGKLVSVNGPDGKPVLLSTDSKGKTLLENLTTFARAKFHGDVTAAGITPAKAMGDILYEVYDPARFVDQGNRGACAAASMQDLLCRTEPAEYVRLITGLLVDKTVATRNGSLTVAEGSLVATKDPKLNAPDLRSHGERIFQSALLARVSSVGEYSYADDSTALKVPKSLFGGSGSFLPGSLSLGGGGMSNAEMSRAMDELFGSKSHDFVSGSGASIHKALRAKGGPAVICMNWDGGKHALVFARSDDTHVYLKDPNGGGPEMEGNRVARTPVNGGGANIRMTIAEFEANVTHAHLRGSGSPLASWERSLPLTPAAPLLDAVIPPPKTVLGAVKNVADAGMGTIVEANRQFGALAMPLASPVSPGGALLRSVFGPHER